MSKNSKSNLDLSSIDSKSAHVRVIKDYFKTTSAENTKFNNYETKTKGLKRGLVGWLNVENKTILDLGSGTGELCWLIKNMGAGKVIGVNLSQDEIDFAKLNVKATFVCQDILEYLSECQDESVDTIYALNILEHLTKDDLVSVLEHSRRVLNKGGHIIAMVPNATSPYGSMTRYWDITHIQAFTPSSVKQLMRLCGFSKVDFAEWGPRVHGVVSFCRYLLWQIIRAGIFLRLIIETGSAKGGVYTADMLFRLSK
jgi:cyclopropane fatty-acyl-phospholipid synthase-like methyltransferase